MDDTSAEGVDRSGRRADAPTTPSDSTITALAAHDQGLRGGSASVAARALRLRPESGQPLKKVVRGFRTRGPQLALELAFIVASTEHLILYRRSRPNPYRFSRALLESASSGPWGLRAARGPARLGALLPTLEWRCRPGLPVPGILRHRLPHRRQARRLLPCEHARLAEHTERDRRPGSPALSLLGVGDSPAASAVENPALGACASAMFPTRPTNATTVAAAAKLPSAMRQYLVRFAFGAPPRAASTNAAP